MRRLSGGGDTEEVLRLRRAPGTYLSMERCRGRRGLGLLRREALVGGGRALCSRLGLGLREMLLRRRWSRVLRPLRSSARLWPRSLSVEEEGDLLLGLLDRRRSSNERGRDFDVDGERRRRLAGGVRLREEIEGLRLLRGLLGDGEREASEGVRDLARSPRRGLLGPLPLSYPRRAGDGVRVGTRRRYRGRGDSSPLYVLRRGRTGEIDRERETDLLLENDRRGLLWSGRRSERPPGMYVSMSRLSAGPR